MEIKYKLWIEQNGKVLFGKGRNNILKAVDEHGSLNAAAITLGMSYRAAWGRLKASEERMGIKLVENHKNNRMKLTSQARAIMERFDILEKDLSELIRADDQNFQKFICDDRK